MLKITSPYFKNIFVKSMRFFGRLFVFAVYVMGLALGQSNAGTQDSSSSIFLSTQQRDSQQMAAQKGLMGALAGAAAGAALALSADSFYDDSFYYGHGRKFPKMTKFGINALAIKDGIYSGGEVKMVKARARIRTRFTSTARRRTISKAAPFGQGRPTRLLYWLTGAVAIYTVGDESVLGVGIWKRV